MKAKHPRKLVRPTEIDEAIDILEKLSGVGSRAGIGETRRYKNLSDLKNDVYSWKKWFDENKCKLTLQYADSALHK